MPEQNKDSLKTPVTIGIIVILAIAVLGSYFFIAEMKKLAQTQSLPEPEVSGAIIVEEPETAEEKEPVFEQKILGYSEKGKVIEGYEIGSGENVLLLHSSMHGDEMGTTDLLNVLIEELRTKPELVATSTKLIIIPIANPDGYFDRTDKLNANGVNLNLNFDTSDWQKYGPQGTFAGDSPFSEKESQVLKQVVEDYKPAAMVAFHSEGALVSPENDKGSIALAKWYAKKTGYTYYTSWDYPGTATKWFVETYNKPAITVELTDDLKGDWTINKKALLELISTPINLLID